ncbi:MAG: hypothetical protein O2916_11775 [Proteobacteria bacterium]|nr:hypothetical protein [Pseudomonadota bacterium]
MYESGNEDIKINEDKTIETINESIQADKLKNLETQNETLKKMVENRNQELKKENSDDKILALSNVLGINKMKAQIDELNQGQNSIIGKLSEVITGMNNITQAVNTNVNNNNEPIQTGNPLEKIELITSLIDRLGPLYSIYKQNQTQPPAAQLIDPEYINQKVKNSIMGNFELGEALIDSLKNKVINKALTKTVSQIIDNDEPA